MQTLRNLKEFQNLFEFQRFFKTNGSLTLPMVCVPTESKEEGTLSHPAHWK